jgi:dTDP-4-amino-4,6-dideoxygalactose transaminase
MGFAPVPAVLRLYSAVSEPIPITQTVLGDAERAAVLAPLGTGWLVQGPHVAAFEQRFAAFTGAPHALATSSCSTALHAALAALGIGPGDEVIVPAFTWVASANAAEHLGARAVFVDVSLDTFNLDPDLLEAAVTSRTRAIVPVHLFGLAADMDAVLATARRHDLYVVEDAACGFGTTFRGAHVGTLGDAGCFSFHPRKAITTGEGGMVTTRDPVLAERVASLRNHGAGGGGFADYPNLGYNFRLTDLQGALGAAQMDRADAILSGRRDAAARYDALLSDLDGVRLPSAPAHTSHSYQSYVVHLASLAPGSAETVRQTRDAVMADLDAQGIATRQGTHAVTGLAYYADTYGFTPDSFPGAHLAERASLALPLFPQITPEQQARVADALARALAAHRPRALFALS